MRWPSPIRDEDGLNLCWCYTLTALLSANKNWVIFTYSIFIVIDINNNSI